MRSSCASQQTTSFRYDQVTLEALVLRLPGNWYSSQCLARRSLFMSFRRNTCFACCEVLKLVHTTEAHGPEGLAA